MKANYHTHTFRCNHAYGTEKEYIENAIKEGLKILGFSDHVPMPFKEGYYSRFRMRPELLEDYMTTLLKLKKEYEGQIKILVGFEAEYYPKLFENMLSMLTPYEYDYLILGQHFIGNEEGCPYSGHETDDENVLKQFVDQCIEGMATGVFTYIAHPDIINYIYDDNVYDENMERLCKAAIKYNMPVELNLLGMEENKCYPRERFFHIASRVGNEVIIGCDAHEPRHIIDHKLLSRAEALAERQKLNIIDYVEIRNPKRK
jgi:histidinol-phosphatase (PHP family)